MIIKQTFDLDPLLKAHNYEKSFRQWDHSCQYRSGRRSGFSIGTERSGFGAFRRAVSVSYRSYIIN